MVSGRPKGEQEGVASGAGDSEDQRTRERAGDRQWYCCALASALACEMRHTDYLLLLLLLVLLFTRKHDKSTDDVGHLVLERVKESGSESLDYDSTKWGESLPPISERAALAARAASASIAAADATSASHMSRNSALLWKSSTTRRRRSPPPF